MLHRNARIAAILLALSSLACNALSSNESTVIPSVHVTEPPILTATDNPPEVTDTPQVKVDLNPADYENICQYGQALIPVAAATGYDHDEQWSQLPVDGNPMLPNSYADVNSICSLDEFYLYTFFTTVEPNDVFTFYRQAFANAGYEEVEPFPETLDVALEAPKWSANGLSLTFGAIDVDEDDDEPVYNGALQINIRLTRHAP